MSVGILLSIDVYMSKNASIDELPRNYTDEVLPRDDFPFARHFEDLHVVNLLTLARRGSACEYEFPSKLAESPSNSESARSLDEPMTSDEFERKTMAPRWMEEQYTTANLLLDFVQQILARNFSPSRKMTKKKKLLLGDV
ncbi:hypothetical protein F2Q69_00008046 [Brassica cretica]|uniref:Uncharacterized protein n=1 Tax=Brassica cretica TaxID=69181 RepID=A0A8S9PLE6_BRACR|nr:hypothetical protein F2Q69_00008046 [Brassica cretica]